MVVENLERNADHSAHKHHVSVYTSLQPIATTVFHVINVSHCPFFPNDLPSYTCNVIHHNYTW